MFLVFISIYDQAFLDGETYETYNIYIYIYIYICMYIYKCINIYIYIYNTLFDYYI